MVLDSKLEKLREKFQIRQAEDWCFIRVSQVMETDGIGPQTLEQLRLYLASRGLTLMNDGTPNEWLELIGSKQVEKKSEFKPIICDFRIAVDVQEKIPFTFEGITDIRDGVAVPIHVPTTVMSLGPHNGDYSIEEFPDLVSVERKSTDDALGTFLSHGERRERWEKTLSSLAEFPFAAIIIECTFGTLIASAKSRGARSETALRRELHRQLLAWQQDYRIPFIFCDDRRLAEVSAFHVIRRAWRKLVLKQKRDREVVDVDAVHDSI